MAQGCGRSPADPDGVDDEGCSKVVLATAPCDEEDYLYSIPFEPLSCPSRSEVEEVQRDIPVTVKSDPSAGTLACREADGSTDLTQIQFLVYKALLFLRRLQFDAPLPWTNATVYDWLRATIPKGIVIDSVGDAHSCLGCPGPITLAYDATLWAQTTFGRTLPSLPYETIVHEARHAEGWPHTCKDDGTPGRYTSDRAISEMGANGVGYYLNYWLAYHSHEDPLIQLRSRIRAAQYRQHLFCCECQAESSVPWGQ